MSSCIISLTLSLWHALPDNNNTNPNLLAFPSGHIIHVIKAWWIHTFGSVQIMTILNLQIEEHVTFVANAKISSHVVVINLIKAKDIFQILFCFTCNDSDFGVKEGSMNLVISFDIGQQVLSFEALQKWNSFHHSRSPGCTWTCPLQPNIQRFCASWMNSVYLLWMEPLPL